MEQEPVGFLNCHWDQSTSNIQVQCSDGLVWQCHIDQLRIHYSQNELATRGFIFKTVWNWSFWTKRLHQTLFLPSRVAEGNCPKSCTATSRTQKSFFRKILLAWWNYITVAKEWRWCVCYVLVIFFGILKLMQFFNEP